VRSRASSSSGLFHDISKVAVTIPAARLGRSHITLCLCQSPSRQGPFVAAVISRGTLHQTSKAFETAGRMAMTPAAFVLRPAALVHSAPQSPADLFGVARMSLAHNDGDRHAHLAPHADGYSGNVIFCLFQHVPQAIHGLL